MNYAEGPAKGIPLVLLHGGSARWQSALPILPALTENWHVFAPDLRGHGKSEHTPGHYTLEDYASDIALFLEQQVKEPAILFGHSLGGQIGIVVAAGHPDLVKALIIGDSPFDLAKLKSFLGQSQDRLIYWRNLAASNLLIEDIIEGVKNTPIKVEGQAELVSARKLFGEDNPWFHDMAENLQCNDPDMLTHVIEFDRMHAALDYQKLFPLISCPVLLLQGNPAKGGILSDEEVDQARQLLSSVTISRLETVGHSLHTEQPEAVLQVMLPFLNRL